MEFMFQISPYRGTEFVPQVSRALEKRTELASREKLPKLWALTDKLNSMGKAPEAVRERRRKRRVLLGLLDWLLGLFLLVPGWLSPRELLIPLLAGAAAYGAGFVILWRSRRGLLAVLSLLQGGLFCVGALGNPAELGPLLYLGVFGLGIFGAAAGVAALLTRRHSRKSPYGRAAEQLLREQGQAGGSGETQVRFSDTGMVLAQKASEEGKQEVPYSAFESVIETEDFLVLVYGGNAAVLQKQDLMLGNIEELRNFLVGRTDYIPLEMTREK